MIKKLAFTLKLFVSFSESSTERLHCTRTIQATVERAKKCATCFPTLLQNELKSDVARFTTHVQTCLTTSQVVANCVNTDFWLDKITRKLCHTRALRHLLEKCATCTDFVAKSRTTLSQHRYSSRFATYVSRFCARFTVPLHAWMERDEPIGLG